MQISFINKKLAKLLGSQKETLRTYGPDNGRRILLRLQQVADAETLAELAKLPQTRVHELKADRSKESSGQAPRHFRISE